MILLPIESVKPYINPYYTTYGRDAELLGFMPCSWLEDDSYSSYYSCRTTKNSSVVPIFFIANMVFDSEPADAKPGPALFFKGSDDGHMGLKFESREAALKWIDDQPINDFELMLRLDQEHWKQGKGRMPFFYHN